MGASLGGRIRPWSSPWVMIIAPTKRVENPQEVVQACCNSLFQSRNWISKALAKFCPQEVRRAGLQGACIAHHGFDGGRLHRTGEFLLFALEAGHNRNGGVIDGEIGVHVQHAQGFFTGFLLGGVGSVAFLPVEFQGAQEQARVRSSQRTTLPHWLINTGRSR